MTRFARIADGRVAEVITLGEVDPADALHPDIAATLVAATAEAEQGWGYADGVFSAPPPPPAPPPEARLASARAECARRIFARASAVTQQNMSLHVGLLAAIPEGKRTAADKADLEAALDGKVWIDAMRARWPEIAAEGLDPADDANWPKPSAAAVALAARF
jgi:hypothetical protein